MMFFGRRPIPQFGHGDLLLRSHETEKGCRYMVVREVRWTTPTGERTPLWVYDGILIEAYEGEIFLQTGISCVPEGDLCKVTWGEWNQNRLDPRILAKVA